MHSPSIENSTFHKEKDVPEKKTGAEGVRWDLSKLYDGDDDPRIDADLRRWAEQAECFNRAYKGRLATNLGDALRDFAGLDMLATKPMYYLELRKEVETGNEALKAKIAAAEKVIYAGTGEWLEFFAYELIALADADADIAWQANSDWFVAKHLPFIENVRRGKPHLLAEEVEAALTKRGAFGPGSWSAFYNEIEASLRFDWDGASIPLAELMNVLQVSKDPEERARALKTANDGLKGPFAKFSAQTLYMAAGSKEVEDRERGYRHPMDKRNKDARIPDAVVESLHEAVSRVGAPLTRRYYRLKADLLGLERLRWSDRNAPMPFSDTTAVPWDHATETVVKAYASFSPTLAGLVRRCIDRGWIDAAPSEGKHGGAFNSSFCLPGGNEPISYTLMNYHGSNEDVMTLAHELGHAVHGLLAGEAQGPLMISTPMAYAETASVFGEMTTFNYLKAEVAAKGDVRSLLALVMDKLDSVMNTVVRQVCFSNFERRVHGHNPETLARSATKRHSVEELCAIWNEETCAIYGAPGDVFTYEDTDHLWSYIHHFHSPFYVYAYAFGELLTQSLYAARPRIGEAFEPLYLDLLRAGGTKDCVELLAPFGIDPTDPSFWEEGIRVGMENLLTEAEELAKRIG